MFLKVVTNWTFQITCVGNTWIFTVVANITDPTTGKKQTPAGVYIREGCQPPFTSS
ncbi:hypothetical protein NXW13_00730 [Bacteroides thetaiotaomicron]|nr:hypothetical protein [Bacteroides thetaiotaomicron]